MITGIRSIHERIFFMQYSKLSIAPALAAALLCVGCGRQAAVTTAATPAVTRAATENSPAEADPDTQCKSWGIQPNTPGYKQCVDAMAEAANAAAGAAGPQGTGQAHVEAAKMRADMAQQGEDLRKQINDQMKAAASDPKCVTVTNGTNTSTSCP
jgi:hypothetical protein